MIFEQASGPHDASGNSANQTRTSTGYSVVFRFINIRNTDVPCFPVNAGSQVNSRDEKEVGGKWEGVCEGRSLENQIYLCIWWRVALNLL